MLFLTQSNEDKKVLHNFRIAKRMMAVAFFLVAAGNLFEIIGHASPTIHTTSEDLIITLIVTLSISVAQAFLLTLVCIMLLDPKNIKSRNLAYQTVAIFTYIVVAVLGYMLLLDFAVQFFIYLLNAIYFIIIIYFTVLFVRHYLSFRQWINALRIEEAKQLITENPKITMIELATRLGDTGTSTFFRQFKAIEGVQTTMWKKDNLSS